MFNGSPLNLIRFGWTTVGMSEKLKPSVRYHRFSLGFDPTESNTREMEFALKWGVANKLKGETPKYNRLAPIKNGQLESFPEWQKLLPIEWKSNELGQVRD